MHGPRGASLREEQLVAERKTVDFLEIGTRALLRRTCRASADQLGDQPITTCMRVVVDQTEPAEAPFIRIVQLCTPERWSPARSEDYVPLLVPRGLDEDLPTPA